ncbi:HAMP domain-containing sensor histidine kinase [Aquimarina sp. MMG016]|uniref:sensor histidine kinase n=1 Tax=Aquimarina sp. MMG016 TaxID=2822690 RepID=UPI001B3A28AC|nr:HAMP domain-containing sensor histidine kinase [Aquimarina sp. MMG016]MBQ4820858.1 HAMP domain-containing histidine kinase [Aquimarina sp. MMG016]
MNFLPQKIVSLFKFDKVLFTILFIVLPGVILDGLVEYNQGGTNLFFIRSVVTFAITIIGLICYRFSLVRKSFVLTILVYTIVISMMISLMIGLQDPEFAFTEHFLKTEVIVALLIFAAGMLVHFRHIIILLIVNILFIASCSVVYSSFPLEKFMFYTIIVSGGGLMAYFSQRLLVKLSRKVKEANTLIRIKNEELREMNESKDELFRIIGHDLRTPFHQLKLLVELIDQAKDQEEKDEIKSLLKQSANKGNKLLEDLLKWGKTYQQQSEVVLEKRNLSLIVNRVFEFSDFKRKRKEISLVNMLPENLEIAINATMMETVLRNLIANAIKFSHRGSNIVIRSQKENRQLRIEIVDNGIGMSDERIGRLFQEDKNISTLGTDNEKGTGYGLSIAKRLVEKQNGIMEIKSEYRKGTTINLIFPLGLTA